MEKSIPVIQQVFPGIIGGLVILPKLDGPVRAGFLAKPAKDAAEQVDLVNFRKTPMRGALRRLHPDAMSRANGRAELTGHTIDIPVFIPRQLMETAETGIHRHLLFRILDRDRAGEEGTER